MGILGSTSDTGSNIVDNVVNTATGGLVNTAMGLIFGGAQDARQRKQQQALTDQQVAAQEQLTGYNAETAYQQWKRTNFPAQMEQIKEAQLSPGLIYGGSGAGGNITSVQPGSVTGGQAANSAQTTQANTGMGMMIGQQELMAAQTEQAKASADLMETQAKKAAGVDTENVTADTGVKTNQANKILADTENVKADTVLKNIQSEIDHVKSIVAGQTIQQQINTLTDAAKEQYAKGQSALLQTGIDVETQQTKTDMIKQQFGNMILNAIKTNAETNKINTETQVEQFKAAMAKAGISPDSPWYVKSLEALAQKAGIDPLK